MTLWVSFRLPDLWSFLVRKLVISWFYSIIYFPWRWYPESYRSEERVMPAAYPSAGGTVAVKPATVLEDCKNSGLLLWLGLLVPSPGPPEFHFGWGFWLLLLFHCWQEQGCTYVCHGLLLLSVLPVLSSALLRVVTTVFLNCWTFSFSFWRRFSFSYTTSSP